ncbi:MAG: nitrogen regulation protein NR(II) [Desulfovibrionaceae bacterium]
MADHDPDRCLCLYGSGAQLLDCFELAREAGVAVFDTVDLAAAPTAPHAEAAREARLLGIDWHEDVQAMLAAMPESLLAPLGPEAAVPAPLPEGCCLLPAEASRLFFQLLARSAGNGACRPDLARARRLLATVLDRVDEEIALLTPDGFVLDANAALAMRLGLTREAVIGRAAAAVFPDFPDLAAPGNGGPPLLESLSRGRKATRENSRVDGRGRLRYSRTTFYPVSGPSGALTQLVALRRDITEDVFLERRLQKSERLAAIGELSMFISHEIRNPLFAIAGFANALLRAKDLGETSREKATIILTESKRLDDILKDIINFARPVEGKTGEADLGEVARRTMALVRLGLEKQGISVTLDLAPGAPMARGDPDILTQCLLNCLTNAREAMPEGGSVTVSTGRRGDRVTLAVADTGPGIPPDVLPRVFNPFFTTRDKRAGLGLAMIKKILEDLGGSVEIESPPGQGTTVTLLLPPVLELATEEP